MADQPVGQIIKNITEDLKVLARDEVQLAKSELVPAAKNAGIGAGMFAGAGFFGISAVFILYFAAAYGLVALGLSQWLAFLIVGVVLLLIAGLLGLIGYSRVKKVKAPQRAIRQATQTVADLKAAVAAGTAEAKATPEIEGEVVAARAIN